MQSRNNDEHYFYWIASPQTTLYYPNHHTALRKVKTLSFHSSVYFYPIYTTSYTIKNAAPHLVNIFCIIFINENKLLHVDFLFNVILHPLNANWNLTFLKTFR